MTHNISLYRGWLGRVITITVLSVFVPLTTTACFGTFPLARKVYRWNASVHSDKWVRWLVFLLINIIPVYAGAAILDMVFSNSVEFWTGRNPMAAAPGSTKLVEGPNNLLFKIVGKNEKSQGQALDLVNILCERVD